MKKIFTFILLIVFSSVLHAAYILIPMDDSQTNCLKAYGIAYMVLKNNVNVEWLLNYRGGSFMFQDAKAFEDECTVRGVSYEVIADVQEEQILKQIANPDVNMDAVKLVKAPKIAVYTPPAKRPWDDAVTMVLTYAEIPYDKVYDKQVLAGKLPEYDWLHLHHEDFTGQFGKFYAAYRYAPWYQQEVADAEKTAHEMGFSKVSQLKLAVAKKIRDFVAGGGFLFAMCSAPDSYDIALAADGVDICASMFDGDPADPNANKKLDYSKTFAFTGFSLDMNPYDYSKSNIDTSPIRESKYHVTQANDLFTLFDFSAKWDPVPCMLCQDQTRIIKGFWGQTTGFNEKYIKPNVTIMGQFKSINEARYIHGNYGKGTWTFYSGHDPEDYKHHVGDPPTDLNLHPNSPGYRLILNNVLFPAAKKKKRQT